MFTWGRINSLSQSRIDNFLVSDNFINGFIRCEIKPGIKLDHSIINLTFKRDAGVRGLGFWKFNSMLIRNNDYVNKLKNKLDRWKEKYDYFNDKRMKWEILKYKIKKFTINYSKAEAKIKKEKINNLEQDVEFLETNLTDNLQEYSDKKMN